MTAGHATEENALGRHRPLLQIGLYLFEAAALSFGEEGADKREDEHGDDSVTEEGDAGSDRREEDGKVWETADFSTTPCQTPGVLFTARLTDDAPEIEVALV